MVQGTVYTEEMDPVCEQYLYAASRAQTLKTVVKPVLDRGGIVVADRSVFTSVAFQGYGRGLGPEIVWKINDVAVNRLLPDRVLFINTDMGTALSRAKDKVGDKFDSMGPDFFARVIEGYMYAVATYNFVRLIDGNGTEDEVAQRVWQAVSGELKVD